MVIELDRAATQPLYLQISQQLKTQIRTGELAAGVRLPPERRLAAMLGVNRTTVVNAYRELAADGLVAGHVGRGTVVVGAEDSSGVAEPSTVEMPWEQLFNSATEVMNTPLLRDTRIVSARTDVISFATGIPSPELYPIDTIRGLLNSALNDAGQSLLQYCPIEGYQPLREALAARMTREQGVVDPAEILVAAGSQQGLYLLASTMIEPGDLVAIESPTYLGALQVFRAAGARLLSIPVDERGMRVELLEDLIGRRRPKLIYTLPTFQNPTGTTMSYDRRQRLLALAARYQVPIIEDDPYGSLRYEGRSIPSLHALDRRGSVIYSEHRFQDALPRLPHRLDRGAATRHRAAGPDEADRRPRYQPAGAVGCLGVSRARIDRLAPRTPARGLSTTPGSHDRRAGELRGRCHGVEPTGRWLLSLVSTA